MAKKKRTGKKRTRRNQETKTAWIIDKMREHVRLHQAVYGHQAKPFTMHDVAKITGYSRSTKLMDFLTEMCDSGFLILKQKDVKPTGVADVVNHFWLPESWADRMEQKRLLEVPQ